MLKFRTASFLGKAAVEVHAERPLLSAIEPYYNLIWQVLRSCEMVLMYHYQGRIIVRSFTTLPLKVQLVKHLQMGHSYKMTCIMLLYNIHEAVFNNSTSAEGIILHLTTSSSSLLYSVSQHLSSPGLYWQKHHCNKCCQNQAATNEDRGVWICIWDIGCNDRSAQSCNSIQEA
jgi:hypothetical protein